MPMDADTRPISTLASSGRGREITGRHVLFGALAAFAVVFTVNMIMISAATQSFPGLVDHKNPWNASQNFDARSAELARLGWRAAVGYEAGRVVADIATRSGAPAVASEVTALVGRPTNDDYDQEIPLTRDPATGRFSAPVALETGRWRILLTAEAVDGTRFQAETRIRVR